MPLLPIAEYSNKRLDPIYWNQQLKEIPFRLKASTVYPMGTIVGELTASRGTMAPYASGNADGSQLARGVVRYPVATDASGNIYFSDAASSEFGEHWLECPIIVGGAYLRSEQLVGLDANAMILTCLNARVIYGTIVTGVIFIP